MNNKNLRVLASAAAVLSLGLANQIQAQDTSSTVRANNNNNELRTSTTATTPVATSDTQAAINKSNKASSLIGMDVRNEQNEKLGEIKDLVVDLPSGKIDYAVLSVGGFLGIGDKYVAVPPGAFTIAPDQQRVVLNADKAKIQNAPGFAKSSWPEVNSPTWQTDSAYWLPSNTAQGTIGTTRTGTASDQALPNTLRDNTRANPALDSSTTSGSRLNTSALDSREQFRGRITAINPETRTMTVEGPSGTRHFKFSENPVISLKDSRNPHLSDLKVGYPVAVGYHENNGTYTADTVIRSDAPEVK